MPRCGLLLMVGLSCLVAGCDRPPDSQPRAGIAFVSDRDGNWEIYLIQPDGSGLQRLTDAPAVDADPAWSPDGLWIAFRSRRDGSSDIFVMGADGSQPRNLVEDAADSFDDEFGPAWNPDGQSFALYTDRFQPPMGSCPGGLGVHHLAFMPLEGGGIGHFDGLAGEQESLAWSPDGNLAFSSRCNELYFQIYIWDMAERAVRLVTDGEYNYTSPAWSPDGRSLALVSNRDGSADIFLLELSTGALTNLTQHPASDTTPSWSPDGRSLAFATDRDANGTSGAQEIYVIDIESLQVRNLTNHPADDFRPAWSPVESEVVDR